jgi:hypothetical protein
MVRGTSEHDHLAVIMEYARRGGTEALGPERPTGSPGNRFKPESCDKEEKKKIEELRKAAESQYVRDGGLLGEEERSDDDMKWDEELIRFEDSVMKAANTVSSGKEETEKVIRRHKGVDGLTREARMKEGLRNRIAKWERLLKVAMRWNGVRSNVEDEKIRDILREIMITEDERVMNAMEEPNTQMGRYARRRTVRKACKNQIDEAQRQYQEMGMES